MKVSKTARVRHPENCLHKANLHAAATCPRYAAIIVVAIGDDRSEKEHSQGWLWHKSVRDGLFAGRGYWLVVFEFSFAGYGGDDLAAVKAAVLYENFRGLEPAYYYAC